MRDQYAKHKPQCGENRLNRHFEKVFEFFEVLNCECVSERTDVVLMKCILVLCFSILELYLAITPGLNGICEILSSLLDGVKT